MIYEATRQLDFFKRLSFPALSKINFCPGSR